MSRTALPGAPRLPSTSRVARFEIAAEVARDLAGDGTTRVVYRARDPILERDVELTLFAGDQDRLLARARLLARIDSDLLTRFYEAGVHGDSAYVAGQLPARSFDAQAPPALLAESVAGAAAALAELHDRSVVHGAPTLASLVRDDDQVRLTVPVDPLAAARGLAASYRAPELNAAAGGEPTPETDVFALCASAMALADTRAAGNARLRRTLAAGLAAEASARPSARSLVRSLRRLRAPRWRHAPLAIALALAGVAATGVVATRAAEETSSDACRQVTAAVDAAWSPARRATLQAAFARSGAADAERRWQRFAAVVEDHADRWRSVRLATCRADDARRADDRTGDAIDCLREAARALDAALAVVETGERDIIEHAVHLADALPSPEACRRPGSHVRRVRADGLSAARAARAAADLTRADALLVAGKPERAWPLARAALGQTRRLDDPSLGAMPLS